MSENLRKELGIDEWLELVKEDKNLDSAYISFAQYMYILEQENQQLKEQIKLYETYLNRFFKINNKSYDGKVVLEQLKQRDEVIDEIANLIENTSINCDGQAEDLLGDISDILKNIKEKRMSKAMKIYNQYELESILKNPKTDFNNFYKNELVQLLEKARELLKGNNNE